MLTQLRELPPEPITAESFAPYGQLITPQEDGKPFDEQDAQLELNQGQPRFYLMRLHHRGYRFHQITRHERCSQCLGSLQGQNWYLAVAPPTQGNCPDATRLKAFHIPGTCFVKLHRGTWHAGPYFEAETVDFYNLELTDTNVTDYLSYDYLEKDGVEFSIIPKPD
ncbi:MAG: ureidoglycolate lyase [Phormidium sp. BM_Day4_Bin.17]|nr:ureidoglycolate lyase [Phormidium sp. BM_Day4_Bin.17]UCJ11570.1 MAG: ureidoglycolate lyase [Phormidium sp. PBR-2020]